MGGGAPGAILMTIGIFLPAFSFTLIGHNLFERIVDIKIVRAILDGITASVIGQVGMTSIELIRDTAAKSAAGALIFGVTLAFMYQIKSAWVSPVAMVCSALAGQILFAPQ
jgi:chromate transporter